MYPPRAMFEPLETNSLAAVCSMAIITLKPDQTFEEGDIIRMGSHVVEVSTVVRPM